MLHTRCRQQLLLAIVMLLALCVHASAQRPAWLLGLPDLVQQQQHAASSNGVAGRIQSVSSSSQQASTTPVEPFGKLLRPQSVPTTHEAEHTATLQATTHAAQPTLSSVAQNYGVPASQLRHMMGQDQGLLLARNGLLVWACSGTHSHAGQQQPSSATWEGLSGSSSNGGGSVIDANGVELVTAAQVAIASLHAVSSADVAFVNAAFNPPADDDEEPITVVIPPTTAAMPATDSKPPKWPTTTGPADPDPITAALQNNAAARPQVHTASLPQLDSGAMPQSHKVYQQPGPQPPPNEAFQLHNRAPGSVPHTIFLDFRSCSITGTAWNAATHKPVLDTQPYDLDGNPSSFSVRERQAIVSIWQAVAQDFAAWQVDVTTEDPGRDALVRESADDARFGMHVCIGGSSATTVGGMSGGLAFTGAWGQLGSGLQPVLVFPAQLGDGHPRAVADSISHEVGHTFGLSHFGGAGAAPYNDGSGPWGPLLGLPYGRVLSQWFSGTAVGGAPQDDLHLIAQQLPLLGDDHGDSPAAATALCSGRETHPASVQSTQGSGPMGETRASPTCERLQGDSAAGLSSVQPQQLMQAAVRGVLSNSSDTDWFKVHVSTPGPMHVELQLPSNVDGYGVNNLLAAVTVWDSQGTQLATAQPKDGSEVALRVSVDIPQPGVYFISAAPVGVAAVTSYGSLGDYLLLVTYPVRSAPSPPQEAAGLQAAPPQPKALNAEGCEQGSCVCDVSKGLAPRPLSAAFEDARLAATRAALSCQYQDVRPLSFNARTCSTAAAGATVLLNFTVSGPPACFSGSIIATAPQLQQLEKCPCRSRAQAHSLPVPYTGARVPTNGSFVCRNGVYTYGWQVPHMAPGCYRLTVVMADGSSVVTVLRLTEEGVLGGPVAS